MYGMLKDMQFVGQHTHWKVTSGAKNLVLQVMIFQDISDTNSQARQA
jgi:hypothetical protein